MDITKLLCSTFVLIAVFVKGTSGDYCYNSYYGETYDCKHGCCGDYYDYDYGCCSMSGTIAGAVVGGIIFFLIIGVVIFICFKHMNKSRGRVINHPPQNNAATVTVIQPPPYQPHGPVNAPPTYPGPPPGGPGYYPGNPQPQQPQMYPPPPPPNAAVYPPKY